MAKSTSSDTSSAIPSRSFSQHETNKRPDVIEGSGRNPSVEAHWIDGYNGAESVDSRLRLNITSGTDSFVSTGAGLNAF